MIGDLKPVVSPVEKAGVTRVEPAAQDGRVLETRDLVKAYRGRRVVDGVSIRIRSGEVVGLLGPNGAGKTTTFYMVVGLTRPGSGVIALDGEDITHVPMYRRAQMGISYLPQEASIFRKLTVAENIMAILETLPISATDRQERLQALMEELGVAHLARQRAHGLSGGERRRVEIARALVRSPRFILLDEPFAGIDPIAVKDIQRIVAHLRERGIGVLITDHNVRDTLKITDRAYLINEGVIIESGSSAQITGSQQARTLYLGEDFTL